MSAVGSFDDLADLYDLLSDWDRRLPLEVGFLENLLRAEGAATLLDAACGTGAHLMALESAGFRVAGADLSSRMLKRARYRLGEGARLVETDFASLPGPISPQDAVVVLGNSLPAAGTEERVRDGLAGLAAAVVPGGILILHSMNFNLQRKMGGGLGKPREVRDGARRHLFLKLFDVLPEKVVLHVIALTWDATGLSSQHFKTDLWPVERAWLETELEGLGFAVEQTLGGFDGRTFDVASSPDLLVIARKSASM